MTGHVDHPGHRGHSLGRVCLSGLLTAVWLGLVRQCHAMLVDDQLSSSPLRVASFNIRSFGNTKMADPVVADNIVSILRRYDLVLVLETRDVQMTSLDLLREKLGSSEWEYVSSEPVGRTSYKEQYVYFYRPEVVTLQGTYKFKDGQDVFERDPYLAEFRYTSPFAGSEVKVTLIGAHLAPDDVVAEMEALPDVITEAQRVFPESGAYITLGDLNADCDYMNCAERAQTALFSSPERYTSLLPDKADTTVSLNTECAYDRVVLTVHDRPKVKVANVKAFDFQVGLGLTFDQAWAVSDHYPVEFTLE